LAQDPRTILDDVARTRQSCEILGRDGAWNKGSFVRVDKAGVVVVAPGSSFSGGEDVRVCFEHEGGPCTFEASVLRAGVPVPDRSQHGLMLGFIDGFKDGVGTEVSGPQGTLTVLPPVGRGLELLGGEARVVDLSVQELTFTVPAQVPLKFVEGGTVRLRFRRPDLGEHGVEGLVLRLSPSEGWVFYGIRFEEVDDTDSHLRFIESFRKGGLQGS